MPQAPPPLGRFRPVSVLSSRRGRTDCVWVVSTTLPRRASWITPTDTRATRAGSTAARVLRRQPKTSWTAPTIQPTICGVARRLSDAMDARAPDGVIGDAGMQRCITTSRQGYDVSSLMAGAVLPGADNPRRFSSRKIKMWPKRRLNKYAIATRPNARAASHLRQHPPLN